MLSTTNPGIKGSWKLFVSSQCNLYAKWHNPKGFEPILTAMLFLFHITSCSQLYTEWQTLGLHTPGFEADILREMLFFVP